MTASSVRTVIAALWRFLWQASILVGASAGTVAAVLYIVAFSFPKPSDGAPAPADFNVAIGLILTAVTVVLAALAIVLAVAAVVGYAQLKAAVERIAAEEAREMAKAVTPDAARPVAQAIADATARAVASNVAREVAGAVSARTVAAAMQRAVESSGEGDDFKSAAMKGEGNGNANPG